MFYELFMVHELLTCQGQVVTRTVEIVHTQNMIFTMNIVGSHLGFGTVEMIQSCLAIVSFNQI